MLARTTWFAPLCSVDIDKALRLCYALQWVADLSMENVDFLWIQSSSLTLSTVIIVWEYHQLLSLAT